VIGHKLYVSHGNGPSAGGGDGKTLYIYDIKSDTWTSGPSANFDRSELMGAAVGGKFYAIGGRTVPNRQIVEIFDPATNTWSQGADMPTGRGRERSDSRHRWSCGWNAWRRTPAGHA
jgi:hypothetical protein